MKLGFFWRLTVLALCFTAFGVGGIIFRITLFPLLKLVPGATHQRQVRTRRFIHRFFWLVIVVLRVTRFMVLDVRYVERLQNSAGKLILANHPSYLDVVVLLGLVPEANCVVKDGLWRSWFFGGVVRSTGYVSNSDADRLVDDCAQVLRNGDSLLIFPEGTRTVPGQPLQLQRGAARIALRAESEIIPVIMTCDPPVLAKGFRLTRIARQPFSMSLEVESALGLDALGIAAKQEEARAARQLTRTLTDYFTRQLERYERPASGNQTVDHRILEPRRSNAG